MPDDYTKTTLDSAISGDKASAFARELKNHDSRMIIKDVVSEHIASSVFADRVKKILLESLESTETYKKLDDKVQHQIDKTLGDRGLRNRNFIIPALLSGVGILIAAIALVAQFLGK